MTPLLYPGDVVLVRKIITPHIRDIIVAPHPFKSFTIIKQALKVQKNQVIVSGVNKESCSSLAIDKKKIIGKVVSKL